MKKIHHVWITVHIKPEDDHDNVLSALLLLVPFDLKEEKLKITTSKAMIRDDREMTIAQLYFEKGRQTNAFLSHLNEILTPAQKDIIIRQKESRLDSESQFFLRFDKKYLVERGEYLLTDSGNCFHVKMTIASFPANRENSLEVVDTLFTDA